MIKPGGFPPGFFWAYHPERPIPLPEPKELRPIPLLDEEERLPPLELELPKLLPLLLKLLLLLLLPKLLNDERLAA